MQSYIRVQRMALLVLSFFLLPALGTSQGYNISGPTVGNLLRGTTDDFTTTGGTNIHAYNAGGSAATNTWSAVQTLPFAFNFYGVPVTQFCVSKNGLVTFDPSVAGTVVNTSIDVNTALPNANLPPLTIAGYWGDFSPTLGTNDDVWTYIEGAAPNRQLWIQYFSYRIDAHTFAYNSIILEEGTNNVYIMDMYSSTAASSFTVGAQLNGTTAVQVAASPNIPLGGLGSLATDNEYYTFSPLLDDDAALTNLSPDLPICPGTYPVTVELLNNGQNNLTSATINWSIDGVPQTPINWTGNLLPNQSEPVSLGGPVTYVANTFYALQADVSNPNGGTDPNLANNNVGFFGGQTGIVGTYTLNSAQATGGTNFQSFADLAGQLSFRGLCGPVVVNVVAGSGPYNEQITFNEIPGSSATNTVTIVGNDETLTFAPNITDRFVLKFNGADYINIEDLNIVGTNATYGYAVVLTNQADFISLENCDINLVAVTSTSTFNSCGVCATSSETNPLGAGNNANNLSVTNSRIFGAASGGPSYGVVVSGGSDHNISNNEISDFHGQGIRLVDTEDALIEGNQIGRPNKTAIGIFYGIYLTGNSNAGARISKNLIGLAAGGSTGTSTSYHIYVTSNGSAAKPINVINNIVYENTANGLIYCLYILSVDHINILHNSISIDQPAFAGTSTTRAFFLTGAATDIRVQNNIFSINRGGSGTKHSYYIATLPNNFTSDYNNIWIANEGSNNNHVGYRTANRTSLLDFQTALTGQEVNAVSVDPIYANPLAFDFTPTDVSLNDAGINLQTEVPDDFNGVLRPTTPDIGAIEFTPAANDAGVIELADLPCPGLSDIGIIIRNFGIDTLNTVVVNATVNGTALPNSGNTFTVSVAPGDTTLLNLGSFTFTVATSYNFEAFTSSPNLAVDANNNNDTLQVTAQTALSGTYTINGALATGGTNYASFNDAVNDLSLYGICSAVVFEVAPGTYTERFVIPSILGTSSTNTVTFIGDNRATCILENGTTSTLTNYVVEFDGAQFITFEDLTVRATGTTLGRVFVFRGAPSNINILNNTIEGPVYSNITVNGALIYHFTGTANIANNVLVQGNTFLNGSYGMYTYGGLTTARAVNNHTLNNEFLGFSGYGIYYYAQDSARIENNILRQNPMGNTTFPYGIYAYYTDVCDILSNEITLYGGTGGYGLWTGFQTGTTSNPIRIANNMISNNAGGTGTVYGFYTFNSLNLDFVHNTIRMEGGSATAGRAIYLNSNATGAYGNIRLFNNLIQNLGPGFTVDISTGANTLGYVSAMNNNGYDIDASVTTPFRVGTTIYPDLAAWQTGSGFDANAVEDEVVFDAIDDLRVFEGASFNNAGTLNTGITEDIDGTPRCPGAGCPGAHARPDIGAHEFIIADNDLRPVALLSPTSDVCSGEGLELEIQVRNTGQLTQTSFPVRVVVEQVGLPADTLLGNYVGSLPYDNVDVVTVSGLNLSVVDTVQFTIITELSGDQRPQNDTLVARVNVIASPEFAFTSLQPNCTASDGIISYNITGGNGPFSELWENGAVSSPRVGLAAGTYALTITAGNGCTTSEEIELIAGNGGLNASASTTDENCNNADGTVSSTPTGGTAPFSYTWSTGATTDALNNLSAGSYTVTVVDANGCVDEQTVSLANVASTLTLTIDGTVDARCLNNGQIRTTALGGTAPLNFLWSDGQNTATASGLAAGSYDLTVTDANGCSDTRSNIPVQADNSFGVSVTIQSPLCADDNDGSIEVQGFGAQGNVDYLWADGQTTNNLTGLASGTYEVTVSDASGCVETRSLTVVPSTTLIPTVIVQNESISGAADGAINLGISGGTAPYTILWSDGVTTANRSGLSAGTYSVTITDANGCELVITETLIVDATSISLTDAHSRAWNVFPNPTSQFVTIDWDLQGEDQAEALELTDALGRRIRLIMLPEIAQGQFQLQMQDLTPAVYYLRLQSKKASSSRAVIKR